MSLVICFYSSNLCFSIYLLGCTARRAVLGIHRSQAGRRGSGSGCGRRVDARRTTATSSIDSATSATGPGRSAAGRCRPCARPSAGPGGKPPPPLPAADAGPGAVRHRHRPWAATASPGAVPHRGLRNPVWGTRRHHRTRPPLRAGAGAARTSVRAGAQRATDSPHVADCRVPLGPLGGRIAGLDRHRRAGASRLGESGGARAGAGIAPKRPPRTPFAGPHVRTAGMPLGPSGGRVAGLDRHRRVGATRLVVSGGVRSGAGIASKRPPRASITVWARGPVAIGSRPGAGQAEPAVGPTRVKSAGTAPGVRAASRVSQAAGGVLTGPRPSPAAGRGRAGRARATRTTPPPEPRAGRRGRPGRTRDTPVRCKGQ
jgi:hypothetical protein